MDNHESGEALDRLNRTWDAVVLGLAAMPNDSADGCGAAIRRLHAAYHVPGPGRSFAAQLWEDLMNQPAPITSPLPHPGLDSWASIRRWPAPAFRLGGRQWRPAADLGLVALLVLMLIGGSFAYRLAGPSLRTRAPAGQIGGAAAAVALFAYDPSERLVTPLDPATLTDLTGGTAADLGPGDFAPVLSADGSTMVSIDFSTFDHVTIIVRDGVTGPERIRFPLPTPAGFPRLSRDGSRLVVQEALQDQPDKGPPPPVWYVLDTRTGRLLTTVRAKQVSNAPQIWMDPAAARLYWLVVATSGQDSAPRPAQLVAFDLATGMEAGQLELPAGSAGFWRTGRMVQGEPVVANYDPGVALSPDGSRLALVNPVTGTVTLVDTASLTVERTITPLPKVSLTDRLAAWLSLSPRDAAAKALEGRTLDAAFAPDGRRLYVWGYQSHVDETGSLMTEGLGLRLVDLDAGRDVAQSLPAAWIERALPTPDGAAIYVFGPTQTRNPDWSSFLLRRLDAISLQTLAQREFDGQRVILLPPLAPGRRPQATPAVTASLALFVQHNDHGRLSPIDPITLADTPDRLRLAGALQAEWTVSSDGSTLVSLEDCCTENANDAAIVVRDGRTGAVHARYHPPGVPVYAPLLSRDGRRLVLETTGSGRSWFVLDTTSGRLLTTIRTDERQSWPFLGQGTVWLDPTATRLYVLGCACAGDGSGPESAHLISLDLTAGSEIGRLDLPDVQAGIWRTGTAAGGEPELSHLTPGAALSPDGTRLAVVHADGAAATLIDLPRFAVERTVTFARPRSALDRALAALPLAPQSAEAKWIPEGTTRAAVFAPDGRHLYVYGFVNRMVPNGPETRRYLGLQMIDVERGEIEVTTAPDAAVMRVQPTPDGRTIYVVSESNDAERPAVVVRRLDARTLQPLAERAFDGGAGLLLMPAGSI